LLCRVNELDSSGDSVCILDLLTSVAALDALSPGMRTIHSAIRRLNNLLTIVRGGPSTLTHDDLVQLRTTLARVSRRFARALVESTLEGQTLYRDAFRMLGVKKTETFNNIGREVGVMG
jgi:hypothetical protein